MRPERLSYFKRKRPTPSSARPDTTSPKVPIEVQLRFLDAADRYASQTPNGLLTVKDVAKRLRVSARTVERLCAAGQLTPLRVRNARRFTPATIERYLREAPRLRRPGGAGSR